MIRVTARLLQLQVARSSCRPETLPGSWSLGLRIQAGCNEDLRLVNLFETANSGCICATLDKFSPSRVGRPAKDVPARASSHEPYLTKMNLSVLRLLLCLACFISPIFSFAPSHTSSLIRNRPARFCAPRCFASSIRIWDMF